MDKNKYLKRGVSSGKEDVHNATKKIGSGIYKKAFCRADQDPNNPENLIVLHADGAGTKSAIAYAYWKKTGDISVWHNIATDALVMNTDDMICVGISDNFFISSTIGRNKNLISADVLAALIEGNVMFKEKMKKYGINILLAGGETADVGDLVRTIIVDATALGIIAKKDFISNEKIKEGNVIVGLSSYGQCAWEDTYNSGIGSNGLTSARHDIFDKSVASEFPETFDHEIADFAYMGKFNLTQNSPVENIDMGKLILSPTRTYLPLMKSVFSTMRSKINGLIHCTGGGQFKCLRFIDKIKVVKDDLFEIPPIFQLIMQTGTDPEEMYNTFNMGHRLEIFTDEKSAKEIIKKSEDVGIGAKVVGYCTKADNSEVEIRTKIGTYNKKLA